MLCCKLEPRWTVRGELHFISPSFMFVLKEANNNKTILSYGPIILGFVASKAKTTVAD